MAERVFGNDIYSIRLMEVTGCFGTDILTHRQRTHGIIEVHSSFSSCLLQQRISEQHYLLTNSRFKISDHLLGEERRNTRSPHPVRVVGEGGERAAIAEFLRALNPAKIQRAFISDAGDGGRIAGVEERSVIDVDFIGTNAAGSLH